MRILQHSTDLTVELEGTPIPRRPDRRLPDGTFEPGDGGYVDNLRVWLAGGGQRLDITASLTELKLRQLEEEALEHHAFGVE